jgi:hypothetical protein
LREEEKTKREFEMLRIKFMKESGSERSSRKGNAMEQ